MAWCDQNPSVEALEISLAIAIQQKIISTLLYYCLTKSASAHVGVQVSLEVFLNNLICHMLS